MPQHTFETETVTLEQAAARLAVTPVNVLLHLKRGVLKGVETTAGWVITVESLASLLRQRGNAPGRAVCQSSCSGNNRCGSCQD